MKTNEIEKNNETMTHLTACMKRHHEILSTTQCYLLHHSSQQRGPKGKAMFFIKILLARSGVAKYNLVPVIF